MPNEIGSSEVMRCVKRVDVFCSICSRSRSAHEVAATADVCCDLAVNGKLFLLAFWSGVAVHPALVRLQGLNTVIYEMVKIRYGFSKKVVVHFMTKLPSSAPRSSFAQGLALPKLWPSVLVDVVVAVANKQLAACFL